MHVSKKANNNKTINFNLLSFYFILFHLIKSYLYSFSSLVSIAFAGVKMAARLNFRYLSFVQEMQLI